MDKQRSVPWAAFLLGCLFGAGVFGLARPAALPTGSDRATPKGESAALPTAAALADPAVDQGPDAASSIVAPLLDAAAAERRLLDARGPGPEEGLIVGTVRTLEGAPLAGARIKAVPEGPGSLLTPPGLSRSGDPRTNWLLQQERPSGPEARSARSDPAGRFELPVPADRLFQLRAELPGWILQPAGTGGGAAGAGRTVDFVAWPAARLVLDLVDEQGRPVDSARLALFSPLEYGCPWSYLDWDRSRPALDLPPGSWRVCAMTGARPWVRSNQMPQLSERMSGPRELELSAFGPPKHERWVLAPTIALYGQLQPPAGDRIALDGFQVRLVPTEGGGLVDPFETWQTPGFSPPTLEGPHFQAFASKPGSYRVEYKLQFDSQWTELGVVELPAAPLRQDFSLNGSLAWPRLEVLASDPAGDPAASLGKVALRIKTGAGSSESPVLANHVLPLAPGRFEVLLRPNLKDWIAGRPPTAEGAAPANPFASPAPTASSEVLLLLQHPTYGALELPLSPGQTRVLARFEIPARLLLRIRGDYRPPQPAWLSVALVPGPYTGLSITKGTQRRLDLGSQDTELEFGGLSPGPMLLQLRLNRPSGGGFGTSELYNQPVDIVAGDNFLTLDLSGTGSLRVRHPTQRTGTLGLSELGADGVYKSADFALLRAEVDGEGWASFGIVVPGRYLLRDDAGELMSITFPCGDVWFEGRAPDCVCLVLEEDSKALIQAGLASGDLLLEFDGEPIDRSRFQTLRTIAQREPERVVNLGIQRAGTRFNLQLPAGTLFAGGPFGQTWIPSLRP
jgi:hypothetical protein